MQTLEMDVTLDQSCPGGRAEFMVKVLDRLHRHHGDTYRRQWTLVPGETTHLRITRDEIVSGPDTRQLELSRVQFVDLLLLEPIGATKVRIDNMRLKLRDDTVNPDPSQR